MATAEGEEQKSGGLAPISFLRNRRTAVSSESVSREAMENWRPPVYPKTEAETSFLRDVVNNKLGMLFGHLTDEQKDAVIAALSRREVKDTEIIIQQGDMGDYFYIVDTGTFDIFVQRGDKAAEKVMVATRGSSFGELALLYNAPRAATCTAVGDSVLWALDRESFKMMLVTSENTKKRRYEAFLEGTEIFKALNRYERCQLSDLLTAQTFGDGEIVIAQGESGDKFYIVEEGEARCTMRGNHGEIEVCRYERGGYFGELALMCDAPRKASVLAASEPLKVVWIDKATFDRVLGPIIEILRENADKYPSYQKFLDRMASAEKGAAKK